MQTVELWRWRVTDLYTGQRVETPYRMSEALALIDDPTAERIEGTRQVRVLGGDDPSATAEARLAVQGKAIGGHFRPGGPITPNGGPCATGPDGKSVPTK